MSIFTSRVTEVLTIPGTTFTVTIRKLKPKHLGKAARVSQAEALANVSEMGGPEALQAFMAIGKKRDADAPAEKADGEPADPMAGFDRDTLIECGVTAWTADQPLNREAIEDLDEDTAEWLGRAVLKLAKPKLFQTEAEAADERGNDSGASTAP